MKNFEVLHTLRIYEPELVVKLDLLMEKLQGLFKNKNEFLTALLKRGYESYTGTSVLNASALGAGAENSEAGESLKEILRLLKEVSEHLILQFKVMSIYHTLTHKLLSAVYRMELAQSGGEKVIPAKIEDGFYDDLPERFEKIITSLETKLGL